ncbi:hypothetical protein EC725_17410 [Escherichia coli]|nr:hypothetical protein EC725_17410 [Escherichia coli]
MCGAGESAVHERRVPEATVCGEYHVIRQPPTFSLTPEGKLTARNADISGAITANTGTLNNVTINENCVIRGKLSANQIEGDLVKTVGKAFPRNNSYASGTVTVHSLR